MIDIHNFSAFRKEYIALIDKVLTKNQKDIPDCEILRKLAEKRDLLQSQVCSGTRKTLANISQTNKRSTKLKITTESSERSEGERRSNSAKKFSIQTFRFKNEGGRFGKKELTNPYDLIYQ
jgi:hypothetical protein